VFDPVDPVEILFLSEEAKHTRDVVSNERTIDHRGAPGVVGRPDARGVTAHSRYQA
jgi:hypothetical protein